MILDGRPHLTLKLKLLQVFILEYILQWQRMFRTFLFYPLNHISDQYNLTWPNLNWHHYVSLDQWKHASGV
jgi:hypothetical protein